MIPNLGDSILNSKLGQPSHRRPHPSRKTSATTTRGVIDRDDQNARSHNGLGWLEAAPTPITLQEPDSSIHQAI